MVNENETPSNQYSLWVTYHFLFNNDSHTFSSPWKMKTPMYESTIFDQEAMP